MRATGSKSPDLEGCLIKGGCATMLVIVALFALLLYSCGTPTSIDNNRVLSPDRQLAFVEHVEGGGGAAGWVFTELWIEADGKKREVASFSHAYPLAVRWLSNSEVTYCSPNATPPTASEYRVKVGGNDRTVRVTSECAQPRPRAGN